jgi:hypothetical protein
MMEITETARTDFSQTLDHHYVPVHYLTANDVKVPDFSDCSKITSIFHLGKLDDYLHLKSVVRDVQLPIAVG